MAIPKKFKKQVKAAMKSSSKTSGDKHSSPRRKKSKVTWNFSKGDLVEYDGGCYFIVDASRGDAWFELMTSDGRKWVRAKDMKKIQTLPEDGKPHANGGQGKV